jgi:hypothetical protein
VIPSLGQGPKGGLSDRGCRTLEPHAREPVQANGLDQHLDLWLGAAQQDRAAVCTQAPGQHREVEHQRRVREHELAEIDDHIRLGTDRSRQRLPADALCVAVLVTPAAECGWLVIEVDDPENLLKAAGG